MKSSPAIFVVTSLLVVAAFSSSIPYTTFQALAEPSGPVGCERTGTVKITCCQEHIINRSPANPAGTLVTYCTDCDIGPGGMGNYINCSERYIKMGAEQPPITPPPGAVARLQEGGVLEGATTLPEVSVLEGQRANISILPRGILQAENNLTFSQANISSSNTSNNTIPSEQSELVVSDTVENTTKTVDAGEQVQDESATTEEGAGEGEDTGKGDENEIEDEDKDTDNNDEESQPQE
jgi:hypothetical protein